MNSLEAQPRLLAFAEREKSANARLRLENASVYPDVTVGVNVAREGSGTAREMPFNLAATTHIFTKTVEGGAQQVVAKKSTDVAQVN